MATTSSDPPAFGDSDLMNFAVRMVVPMRREFGRVLDVPHFLHDFAYAREVLEQAKASEDARLREYAAYLETGLFGPRNRPGPQDRAAAVPQAVKAAPAEPEPPKDGKLSEAEMRARMMSKYKGGLR